MHPPSQEEKERIKVYYSKVYSRVITDAEVLEIAESLYYFAKAKHRYLLIKQGLISPVKNGTVCPKTHREAQALDAQKDTK